MKGLRKFWLFAVIILLAGVLRAQEDEADDLFSKTIDSAMAISPDYLPTSYTPLGTIFFQPVDYRDVDTTMDFISQFDPLNQTKNIYQSLGTFGQAHKSINFSFTHEPGFKLFNNPYPLYFKEQTDLNFYKLKTSYTQIGYTYGIATENNIRATHAQNIRDKVNLVFNIRSYTNEGYFTHQRISNVQGDVLLHYEIPSQIYGFRCSYIINYFNLNENGGLLNAQDFLDQRVKDLQGYNVKLHNAQSRYLTHDLLFHQYVNIITSSAKKQKKNYWGTISHTFQFKMQNINYTDFNLDSTYYHNIFIFSRDSTLDTLLFYTISNTLQYSTFQPYKDNRNEKYFVHFTGGITHEYTNYKSDLYRGNAFMPFAQVHVRLFTLLDLHARIHYTLGGYQRNDLNARASFNIRLGKKIQQSLGCEIDFYYLSPEYILTRYAGNHHFWQNEWKKKQNIVRLTPYWQYKDYRVDFSYFMLHHYVYLDENCAPAVLDDYANVIQLHAYVPFYMKGFGVTGNFYLQYANKEVFQVPVFAGKLDFFYRFPIFKEKAKLQFGFNCAYNTGYYADAYYPLLRQFYHQHDVKTGNYFYWDLYAAIQVQRIHIFFKASHVLSGVMGYNYFTTPDYPMQDRRFAIGLTWRFHD